MCMMLYFPYGLSRLELPKLFYNVFCFCFFLQIIATHVIKLHASADSTRGETKVSKEENWLKRYSMWNLLIMHYNGVDEYYNGTNCMCFLVYRYIHYCRTNCHPRLSESAAKKLQTEYVSIRQVMNLWKGFSYLLGWRMRLYYVKSLVHGKCFKRSHRTRSESYQITMVVLEFLNLLKWFGRWNIIRITLRYNIFWLYF